MNNYIDNTNQPRDFVVSDEKYCNFTRAESYNEWKTHLDNISIINIATIKITIGFVSKLRKSVLTTKRYNQNTLYKINTNDYSIFKLSLGL